MYSSVVKILNVDPGGYSPWVARFRRTELSLSSDTKVSQSSAIVFGSKSGFDTMARILPVSGSITTTAPS